MSELDDDQKRELRIAKREVSHIDNSIGGDNSIPNFGVCNNCCNFYYREYQHGHRRVGMCRTFDEARNFYLNESNKITKCTSFSEKGLLSIESMWAIATIIKLVEDPKIGFGDRRTKKVTTEKNDLDEGEISGALYFDKDIGNLDFEGE